MKLSPLVFASLSLLALTQPSSAEVQFPPAGPIGGDASKECLQVVRGTQSETRVEVIALGGQTVGCTIVLHVKAPVGYSLRVTGGDLLKNGQSLGGCGGRSSIVKVPVSVPAETARTYHFTFGMDVCTQ